MGDPMALAQARALVEEVQAVQVVVQVQAVQAQAVRVVQELGLVLAVLVGALSSSTMWGAEGLPWSRCTGKRLSMYIVQLFTWRGSTHLFLCLVMYLCVEQLEVTEACY